MKFEEEFPSLKGKVFEIMPKDGCYWDDGYIEFFGDEKPKDWDIDDFNEAINNFSPDTIYIDHIKENCVDKAKLKKAIDKHLIVLTELPVNRKPILDFLEEIGI